MNKITLALRMLRRNAKSSEARVLLVALLIAVMSVTTVAFFADRVESALNRQANELIAADVVVRVWEEFPNSLFDRSAPSRTTVPISSGH